MADICLSSATDKLMALGFAASSIRQLLIGKLQVAGNQSHEIGQSPIAPSENKL